MSDRRPIPPPLHQSQEYETALRHLGRTPLRLPDGALALRRRLPGGLQATMLPRAAPRSLAALHDQLTASGLQRSLVILAPNAPLDSGALPLLSPACVAELPLLPDPDRQRAALHQKWRNRLARAEDRGLTVTSGQGAALDWLLRAEEAQRCDRGYRGWPATLTRAYLAANRDAGVLLSAREAGKPIAAVLILRHGSAATYHIGHTTPRGRAVGAHNLLLWRATRQLADSGVSSLELGPLDTESAPGLARFKLGSGAHARRLGGTWLWWPPLGRALRPLGWLDRRLMA